MRYLSTLNYRLLAHTDLAHRLSNFGILSSVVGNRQVLLPESYIIGILDVLLATQSHTPVRLGIL